MTAAENTTDQTSADQAAATTEAGAALEALYTAEWQWREAELGSGRAKPDEKPDDFMPDVSEEAQLRRLQKWQSTLEQLRAIDRDELSAEEQTTYDVYENQLQTFIESQQFRTWERPVTADNAFWRNLAFGAARQHFETADAAEAYLRKLSQVPRYIDQQIENMRTGVTRGFGPAKVCMTGREEPVRAVAQETDAAALPFYKPFAELPAVMPEATRAKLQAEAVHILGEQIIPAYGKLYEFLTTEYLPNLPESIATYDQPEGEAFYASQLREFTTTDYTADQIHAIGVEHVAKIKAEMVEIAQETGFGDDVDALIEFMRTDEQFYAKTPKELVAYAAYTCKAFDGVIHQYFGKLPHQRFSIMETPREIAAFDTFGRGAPDKYILNTYNLPARPLYSLPALTLHESSPGHSFQLSLALELDLPEFRRQYISAFGEGWGLYCERLGDEMGMYETPYERMGMLSFQMWRAVRLVVDTGMHALGWSREQAQDFLRSNTAIAEHEIVTEIDRYISWPGQACAYYLGQLTIEKLRAQAEAELGEAFSIRDFHDKVLSLGSVPLRVLETEIGRFIAEAQTQ
ncbi:DUF885 domain-containing protein [Nesterenkonia alba]|uniref:DUF885 domain-containing protein n=1 Tax=Nesterenkonia alba TaxID=515814 RepID=UPI0003B78E7F|nr:DUF885 domain-containing protein [Nesterenkonia alba]